MPASWPDELCPLADIDQSSVFQAQSDHGYTVKKILIAIGLTLCVTLQAHAVTGTLAAPTDLRNEAKLIAQYHRPLILLFSLPDCAPCEEVRRNYLESLLKNVPLSKRPIIREVGIADQTHLKDFSGATLTQAQFAESYHAKVAPTVVMVDTSGKILVEPLIGGGMAGFYGAYLDSAMADAQKELMARLAAKP